MGDPLCTMLWLRKLLDEPVRSISDLIAVVPKADEIERETGKPQQSGGMKASLSTITVRERPQLQMRVCAEGIKVDRTQCNMMMAGVLEAVHRRHDRQQGELSPRDRVVHHRSRRWLLSNFGRRATILDGRSID